MTLISGVSVAGQVVAATTGDPTVNGLRWFRDHDGDGYGDWYRFVDAATQPAGYVGNNTDCDDNDAAVHPGQKSDPGPGDINCDGIEANDRQINWYRDADKDGWGDRGVHVKAPQTAQPVGYVYRWGDCNDHNWHVHPYQTGCHHDGDIDGDGHRSTLAGGDDCNDADGNEFPGNTERTDPIGHDEDCDPTTGGVIQYDPNFLDPRPHPAPGLRYYLSFGPAGHLRDWGQSLSSIGCGISPAAGYSTGLWCTPPLYSD